MFSSDMMRMSMENSTDGSRCMQPNDNQPTESDTNISFIGQSADKNPLTSHVQSPHENRDMQTERLAECKEMDCTSCLTDNHLNHKSFDILGVVRQLRGAPSRSRCQAISCEIDTKQKLDVIGLEKHVFLEKLDSLESEISDTRDALKKLVDSHSQFLLLEVGTWKQDKLNETEKERERLRSCIKNFAGRMTNGTNQEDKRPADSDKCLPTADQNERNSQLFKSHATRIERQMEVFQAYLETTKMPESLSAYNQRINRNLEDEQELPEFESITSDAKEKSSDGRSPSTLLLTERTLSKENSDYRDDPALILTLRTKSAKREDRGILGLTVLDDELFVVSRQSSEVEVFDCRRLIFSCELELNYLLNPEDITSCKQKKCLYIMDRKTKHSRNHIYRVDTLGRLIRKWSTGDDWGHLSITPKSNVLLSVFKRNKLNEYSPNGDLIRAIVFKPDSNFAHLRHALQLTTGHYVVSHGEIGDPQNRVLKVDAKWNLTKAFNGSWDDFRNPMKRPFYLESDDDQHILVADADNSRVLLLNSSLQFQRVLLSSEEHGLRYPVRLCLDKDLLFVADNRVGNKEISVFLVK